MASDGQKREKEARQQQYFSAAGLVKQTEKRRERKIWKLQQYKFKKAKPKNAITSTPMFFK